MNLCKGFNCMPDTIKPIDDRIFFILYALSLNEKLEIRCLEWLYNYKVLDNAEKILREMDFLYREWRIILSFKIAPLCNDEKISQYIYEHIEEYKNVIQVINNSLNHSEKFLDKLDFHNPIMRYLSFAIGCDFELPENNRIIFQGRLNNYIKRPKLNSGIYSFEQHRQIMKNYFKTPDGQELLPNPKIKLSRLTNLIPDYKITCTRYNFWHIFRQMENLNIIKVNHLFMDECEPTIDFQVLNKKKFETIKINESKREMEYNEVILYNDKITYRGLSENVDRPYKFKLIKFIMENPAGVETIPRKIISKVCGVKKITTATSAVNRILQNLLTTNEKFLKPIRNNDDFRMLALNDFLQ